MFLPERLIALDLEMTGVVPHRDDILQIALVKCMLNGDQYETGESLVIYLHSDMRPKREFDYKYLSSIYEKCNKSRVTPQQAKAAIHDFLGDWKGQVQPFGDCVPTDMMFLYAKDIIDYNDYGTDGDKLLGTFHYEFFELNSVKSIGRHKLGQKEDLGLENAHDALADCYNQIAELNYYLKYLIK